MRSLLNPKWVLVINTIPIILLFSICGGTYSIIHTLLPEESVALWKSFAISLVVIGQIALIFGIVRIAQKKVLNLWYSFTIFITHIPFLYFYLELLTDIVPSSIPGWMVSNDFEIYPYAFLMPTLLHALLVLVTDLTPNETNRNPTFDFLACLVIPVGYYLVFAVAVPFLNHGYSVEFGEHLAIVLSIILTITFLFFFTRGIFTLYKNKLEAWKGEPLLWKVPVGILMPVGGLALNAELNDVFGDFTAWIFYALAVINGILFCLPEAKNKTLRLLQFIARAVFFPYIIYFFLVFVPYLPLSVFAIVLIGTGFLMLTPLILFVLQTKMLAHDFAFLKQVVGKYTLTGIMLIAFAVLPVSITIRYQLDRQTLFEGLDYIYESELKTPKGKINAKALERVLMRVRENQKRDDNRGFDPPKRATPFLTTYYNWLVLDNLNISNSKLDLMEEVFLGDYHHQNQGRFRSVSRWRRPRSQGVLMTDAVVTSTYDEKEAVWHSTIEFELTNTDSFSALSEYSTVFTLPTGAFISDYYLWIGDRKEKGILAEKKAATWIYNQISQTRRDPGILYYLNDNEVAFKVYPFIQGEVRKTGIEFIHKEPVNFEIDSFQLQLGNTEAQEPLQEEVMVANGDVIYIPKEVKKQLPKVTRKPYLHVMLDYSSNRSSDPRKLLSRFRNKWDFSDGEWVDTPKATLVNTYSQTYDMITGWEEFGKNIEPQGGFYLERAIKQDLLKQLKRPSDSYPMYVVLTDNINQAICSNKLEEFARVHPEVEGFYYFNMDEDALFFHRFDGHTSEVKLEEHMNVKSVYAYPNASSPIAYLPIDEKPSIILKSTDLAFDEGFLKENSWRSALYLQGLSRSNMLHPEQGTKRWRELVKGSFMTQTMTPNTAFLALENEAQKAMLRKKQEEVLSGKKSMDLEDEEIERMSEPAWWLIAGLLLLFLVFKHRKKLMLKLSKYLV